MVVLMVVLHPTFGDQLAMSSSTISLVLLLLLLLHATSIARAQPPTGLMRWICGTTGNYTSNSTYHSNLVLLLSSLSTNGSAAGFLKATVGEAPNIVHGAVLCRGDVGAEDCRSCLDAVGQQIPQLCPYNKEAVVWYDICTLRFSNQQFLKSTDNILKTYWWNVYDAPELDRFNKYLKELTADIIDWAAYNSSTKMFATGEVDNFTTDFPILYALAQCTPDQTSAQCRQCLQDEFDPLPKELVGKRGGMLFGVKCNLRYEVYTFYEGAPTIRISALQSQNNSNNSTSKEPQPTGDGQIKAERKGKGSSTLRIVIAVGITVAIAAGLLVAVLCICRRRHARRLSYSTKLEGMPSDESLLFDYNTLRAATSDFSQENKLGQGGFGEVYKGVLPDGRQIAVKKLLANSAQGFGELKNELVLVAKLQHRNLVRVLGVCVDQEKLLVYEYVPNGSLDKFLFDPARSEQLHWGTRFNIIDGIARGLMYLHEESHLKVIHRDLKASNILIDADMNPKISDFGLARLFDGEQTQEKTSRVVGTFGYMAPEYAQYGHFSAKSDVFGFGVLVLEIMTGRRNTAKFESGHAEDLLTYVWEHWTSGAVPEELSSTLSDHRLRSEALRYIRIGLLCVQDNPLDRPTMSAVVLMLSSDSMSVRDPSMPAFCGGMPTSAPMFTDSPWTSIQNEHDQSSTQSLPLSQKAEVSISDFGPR